MARKRERTRGIQRPAGMAIIKEINALMDARIGLIQKRLLDTIPRFTGMGIKPALKALGIPSKKDFERIIAKVASIDKNLSRLIGKQKVRIAAANKPGRKKVKRICKVRGCKLPVRCKEYCGKHYQAWRRKRLGKKREISVRICKVRGCRQKHYGKGYCRNHYMQWRRGTLK